MVYDNITHIVALFPNDLFSMFQMPEYLYYKKNLSLKHDLTSSNI